MGRRKRRSSAGEQEKNTLIAAGTCFGVSVAPWLCGEAAHRPFWAVDWPVGASRPPCRKTHPSTRRASNPQIPLVVPFSSRPSLRPLVLANALFPTRRHTARSPFRKKLRVIPSGTRGSPSRSLPSHPVTLPRFASLPCFPPLSSRLRVGRAARLTDPAFRASLSLAITITPCRTTPIPMDDDMNSLVG